jgi:hypothetical protein
MVKEKFSHYYKKVPGEYIDVYRVLQLFEVTDPCIQHAIKKLLVGGKRGVKDVQKDIKEAIVSLERWQEMREEEKLEEEFQKEFEKAWETMMLDDEIFDENSID